MIPDSIFKGYNGLYNDTLRTSFTTKTERDYGNLLMNYHFTDTLCPYIVQLYAGGKKIQEDIITQDCRIEYHNLVPGDYSISAFRDENRNGQWDSGMLRTQAAAGIHPQVPEEHFRTCILGHRRDIHA